MSPCLSFFSLLFTLSKTYNFYTWWNVLLTQIVSEQSKNVPGGPSDISWKLFLPSYDKSQGPRLCQRRIYFLNPLNTELFHVLWPDIFPRQTLTTASYSYIYIHAYTTYPYAYILHSIFLYVYFNLLIYKI